MPQIINANTYRGQIVYIMWYLFSSRSISLAKRYGSHANGLLEGLKEDTYGGGIGRSSLVHDLCVSGINRIGFNCEFVLTTNYIEIH